MFYTFLYNVAEIAFNEDFFALSLLINYLQIPAQPQSEDTSVQGTHSLVPWVFPEGSSTVHNNSYLLVPFPYAGLTLELNVEQEEYIGLLTPEAGIRMDISTQGEMPFPLERGISLSPGYATMIGLRKVRNWTFFPFELRPTCPDYWLKVLSGNEKCCYLLITWQHCWLIQSHLCL